MNTEKFVIYLEGKGFNNKQINQLVKIKEAGYNLSTKIIERNYITPEIDIENLRKLKNILVNDRFDNVQFSEIVEGYIANVNYEIYANLKFNAYQMEEIKFGLMCGFNILQYCDENYDWPKMNEIRNGLEEKIDVTKYNDIKYNDMQMERLKNMLIYNKENPEKEIDISLFQNENIRYEKMYKLFNMLISNNENDKIEAYRQLNEYNKEDTINLSDDYEK
jgi:hypothetical protein